MNDTDAVILSEPLSYYLKNDKNRQAVQSLLDSKKPPSDLSWEDLERYYQARMAAEQVRLDFWKLCKEVWMKTWGAVDIAKNLNVSQVQSGWKDGEFGQDQVWDEGFIYQVFDRSGEHLEYVFYVTIDCDTKEIYLKFYATDQKKDYSKSNNLSLGNDWKKDPDDDTRVTVANLAPLPTGAGESIDLTNLHRAVAKAIAVINNE